MPNEIYRASNNALLSIVKYTAGNNKATSAFVGRFKVLRYFIVYRFNTSYSIIKVRDYFSPWYTRIEPSVAMKYIAVKNQDSAGLSNVLDNDTSTIVKVTSIIKIIRANAVFFISYWVINK